MNICVHIYILIYSAKEKRCIFIIYILKLKETMCLKYNTRALCTGFL